MSAMLSLLIAISACGEPAGSGESAKTTDPPTTRAESPTPVLMGLALHELLTEANTFGPGHRFEAVLVQTSLDPSAGTAFAAGPTRPLSPAERSAIETYLAGVAADIRWIDDPNDWRTDELQPTLPGAAIVGVGEVIYDDAGALVPVSLWCGGVCGTWFTWRVELIDGDWRITGTEGPLVIS